MIGIEAIQKRRSKSLSSLILILLSIAMVGFSTLYSDRTRWQTTPSYSIQGEIRGIATQDAYTAVRSAFNRWSSAPGGSLSFNEVQTNAKIPVVFLQNWPQEFGENAAGITSTYPSNNQQILSAEVYINDQHFSWSVEQNTPGYLVDLEGVTLHEIGHAIGLTHSFYQEATMYWSVSDEESRSLDQDDIRGFQFLYGNFDAGQMCDTCLNNNGCLSGQCFDFDGKTACGATCGPAPNYLCSDAPIEQAGCYELQDGGSTCLPHALTCSDIAVGVAQEGDYCFGAQQCQNGLVCDTNLSRARCIRLGSAQIGEACQYNAICQSDLCIPLSETYAICGSACNPQDASSCNGTCLAVNDPSLRGVCVPPGSVEAGGACDEMMQRCQSEFDCVGGRCVKDCEPYGDCPEGLACTPVNGMWRCEALTGPQEGEACVENQCGGGLYCLRSQQLCLTPCDPNDISSCAGHTCRQVGMIGLCSASTATAGFPCENDYDCQDLSCIEHPDGTGSVCTSLCGSGCPNGWECAPASFGEQAFCAPIPSEGPVAGSNFPTGGSTGDVTGGVSTSPPPTDQINPVPIAGTQMPSVRGEVRAGNTGPSACQMDASPQNQSKTPPLVIYLLATYAVLRKRFNLIKPQGNVR